ncbi:MAG: hypothetical protein ABI389_11920 [Rhodanobacter sp.]
MHERLETPAHKNLAAGFAQHRENRDGKQDGPCVMDTRTNIELQVIDYKQVIYLMKISSRGCEGRHGGLRGAPSPRHPQTYPQQLWIKMKSSEA